MIQDFESEKQVLSQKSYVDLGLMLAGRILSTKTKLKQINPTLIYEWDGETLNNQISGKGTFVVRHSLTNELMFQCEVKKWKNGVPEGQIKMKKINFFSSDQITDYKVKEIHNYEGNSENLKKHGRGIYILQEFYSSGKVKKTTVNGEWNYDILVDGVMENEFGKKQLNLSKNMEWSKTAKSIAIQPEINPNMLDSQKEEKETRNRKIQKQNNNLLSEPAYKQKYLNVR